MSRNPYFTHSAGLYPNIAYIHTIQAAKDGQKGIYAMYTSDRSRVFIHPSSITFHVKKFASKWVAFSEKIQTGKVYLHDCTLVSPLALVLFGGAVTQNQTRNKVIVDKWIAFNSDERLGV